MDLQNISSSVFPGWEQLEKQGFIVIDDFLNPDVLRGLKAKLKSFQEQGRFKKSKIGDRFDQTLNTAIRNDEIAWLSKEDESNESLSPFFDQIKELQISYRDFFRVSIRDYEFHFAHYAKGSFYAKHLDQFNARSNRMLSIILYLNENWQDEDGGHLRVYAGEDYKDISPIGGRLVMLLSHAVEHEVMMAHRSRYSLTGWLLRHPSGVGFLDS